MQGPEGDRPLPDESSGTEGGAAPDGPRAARREDGPDARLAAATPHHPHHHGRRHHHGKPSGAALVSTGARRRFRSLPWRWIARVAGILLLAAAAFVDARGIVVAALALAVGLLAERLIHRPVALERDRSRRHLRRNLGVGLTIAAAVGLYAFAVGDPTSHLRPLTPASEAAMSEDHAARRFVVLGGATALAVLGLSFLLFGFDRSAERRARRRRAGGGRDATAPA